jgi:hypothetical protein
MTRAPLLLALLFLTACQTDQAAAPGNCPFTIDAICGEWEWIGSNGGMSETVTPAALGFPIRLELRRDGTYSYIWDDQIRRQGSYEVVFQPLPHSSGSDWILHFIDDRGEPYGWRLVIAFTAQNALSLYEVLHPGRHHDYWRLR